MNNSLNLSYALMSVIIITVNIGIAISKYRNKYILIFLKKTADRQLFKH